MIGLKKPTASVTAAGVVAIVGSVLALLGTAGAFVVVLTLPTLEGEPELPGSARAVAAGAMAVFFGLAIFGVFTGVNVLRLRNWARTSMLVCSGVTAALCGCILAFLVLIPFPLSPNTSANTAVSTRVGIGIFYAVPMAIAIWWLILFTRKAIATQFVASGMNGPLDASGFPAEEAFSSTPSLPLPITVLAIFLLISSFSFLAIFLERVPFVLFAHAFRGAAGTAVWMMACLLSTAGGIGLLRRKRWSYPLTLRLQFFWFLSGIVTVLSPNYADLIHEAMSSITFPTGPVPQYSIETLRKLSGASLMFPLLIAVLLLYYRSRFLEASAGTHKL